MCYFLFYGLYIIHRKVGQIVMFLQCKQCGSDVKWESLRLGHLERNVYNCVNSKCIRSREVYIPDSESLPQWITYKTPFSKVG